MTAQAAPGRFEIHASDSLPPLFWQARIKDGLVTVRCGASVRTTHEGVFEGTWAGPAGIACAARAETVFGSGIVLDGLDLVVVAPAHTLEPVFHATEPDGSVVISNSFVATLVATKRELDPDAPYPLLFGHSNRGINEATVQVPTLTDPITVHYFENLLVNQDGSLTIRPKPRGPMFADFADYRDRLIEVMRSCFENAPDYVPTVAMSSGYDSTACAAISAPAGCHHAVSFRTGWPWAGYHGEKDTPEVAARILGLEVEYFDRLDYQSLPDEPDAEFLATGMSGEDAVYRSMDEALRNRILITGYWGGAAWRGHERPQLSRIDLSGASLGEFRLRVGFIHAPLPFIGGLQQPSIAKLRSSAEMKAYSVGGEYDEPFARRLAEEAGVPRGSFGVEKRAASQRIHTFGLDALAASSRRSLETFAGAEALANLPARRRIGSRHRAAIRIANSLHAKWLVAGIVERKLQSVHIEPVLGNLLLRWAVQKIGPRYAELSPE